MVIDLSSWPIEQQFGKAKKQVDRDQKCMQDTINEKLKSVLEFMCLEETVNIYLSQSYFA